MPKIVYQNAYRAVRADIISNYKKGDRYLAIREIASSFSISLQTAQKIIGQLKKEEVITAKPKIGIIVQETEDAPLLLAGKKIIVISNKQDGHFYSSFYDGVKYNANSKGIKTEFMLNTYKDVRSLEFGKYLAGLDADGLIALSFSDSALPFYYCLREGMNIVSDIILDELPVLPTVQTDNYQHAYEAGIRFNTMHCEKVYEVSYYKKGSKRYTGLKDALDKTGCRLLYFSLGTSDVLGSLNDAIRNADKKTGFFISDYAATYIFASLCVRGNNMPCNVLAYDADDVQFQFTGLQPIDTVAPSFKQLGIALSEVLITKWSTGKYPFPLQRKM